MRKRARTGLWEPRTGNLPGRPSHSLYFFGGPGSRQFLAGVGNSSWPHSSASQTAPNVGRLILRFASVGTGSEYRRVPTPATTFFLPSYL